MDKIYDSQLFNSRETCICPGQSVSIKYVVQKVCYVSAWQSKAPSMMLDADKLRNLDEMAETIMNDFVTALRKLQ